MSQKDILEQLVKKISAMEEKMPNGELARMETSILDIQDTLHDLYDSVNNPHKGLIVNTSKNTSFRKECQSNEKERAKTLEDFHGILRWRAGIDKALWGVYTIMAGVIAKIIFFK